MDRDKHKLSRVVKENRQRTYEDITGIVNGGNNHSFCTITMKRNFQNLRYKRCQEKSRDCRGQLKSSV